MFYIGAMVESDTPEQKMRFIALAHDKGHFSDDMQAARRKRDELQNNANNKNFPLHYKIANVSIEIVE